MRFQVLNMRVLGRVQGVGFRYFTQRMARQHAVTGWVRNLPDGSVEIEAVGAPDAMELFLRAVQEGPAFSHVERVEMEKGEVDEKMFSTFEIMD